MLMFLFSRRIIHFSVVDRNNIRKLSFKRDVQSYRFPLTDSSNHESSFGSTLVSLSFMLAHSSLHLFVRAHEHHRRPSINRESWMVLMAGGMYRADDIAARNGLDRM